MSNRVSLVLSAGLLALLAAMVALDRYQHVAEVRLYIPIVSICLLFLAMSGFYGAVRRLGFAKRDQRRAAHAPKIPPGTRRPESYDGVAPLHDAHHQLHDRAVDAQGEYFLKGLCAIILPPLALLLLSLQVVVASEDHDLARGLIVAEGLCLAYFLYLVWNNPQPTEEWIEARVRGELLRREQYLAVAGIGPYADSDSSAVPREVLARLGLFDGSSLEPLQELIGFGPTPNAAWLANGFSLGHATPRVDVAERAKTYLYHRVTKQLHWFETEGEQCAAHERLWRKVLKTTAGLACVIAVLHGRELFRGGSENDSFSLFITVTGFVLPPVGVAILGSRTLYSFHVRHKLYQRTAHMLRRYRGLLEGVVKQAEDADVAPELIERAFKHAVIGVETTLAQEMQQWLLTMRRDELETAP